jgi:LysR family glycine cleavage system transcriptional activator
MRRKLPSFRALESFEAVARCGNVTRAADELGRTQSAVSRQIANLEEFAQRELFIRDRKQLVLNDIGRKFYDRLVAILDELEAETNRLLRSGQDEHILRLGVLPTFGTRWLMPRLSGFTTIATTELHLVKGLGRDDFQRQQVDAAIECSSAQPSDVVAHHLLDEKIVAVIAPSLYESNPKGSFDKLHMPARADAWMKWVETYGSPFSTGNLKFDNYTMLIEAACLGFGIAVLPTIYVDAELSNGRLIAPFGKPIPSGRSYWLTYPEESLTKKKVVEFTRWLLAQRHDDFETQVCELRNERNDIERPARAASLR